MADPDYSTEIWKPIPEWDGLYEASSFGRVRSLPRQVSGTDSIGRAWRRRYPGKVLAQSVVGIGYKVVCLSKDRMGSNHYVHRLVCLAFNGPPTDGKTDAAHIDGSKANNTPDNLVWATSSENQNHKRLHGTLATGERHGMAKVTRLDTIEMRRLRKIGRTNKQIGAMFNISPSQVQRIVAGTHWN